MTGSHQLLAASQIGHLRHHPIVRAAIASCLGLVFFVGMPSHAQNPETNAGCTLNKGSYQCDQDALRHAVSAAKTFAVKNSSRDRVGASQLQSLGASLGKSLALGNQSADLVFVLASTETGGVNYGSMDRELATLKVYSGSPNREQNLIWEETLSDQPDLPWAAVVHRLLEAFRKRVQ